MTAVPVVSATLTTRTQRRWELQVDDPKTRFLTKTWKADGPWVEDSMHPGVRTGVSTTVRRVRERLTADPVFVPLPEAPDLTCQECNGEGVWPDSYGYDLAGLACMRCDGTGVSPVYAATWQWRYIASTKPTAWKDGLGADTKSVRRRQVVEWVARRAEVLPVVEWSGIDTDVLPMPCIMLQGGAATAEWYDDNRVVRGVAGEPWAADLKPGQFVLRLDGWEHLEQPYTMMVERFTSDDPEDDGEERWDTAPLSVPDGVLSWIELA